MTLIDKMNPSSDLGSAPGLDGNPGYSFEGRVRPKKEKLNMYQLVELHHEREAFVYKRLSSHEQVKKSIFSIAMQDSMEDMAIEDGYQAAFSKEQVQTLKQADEYPGWYENGQVIVEERDLGISGTLGKEDREGLAHLITLIESDRIESIYVVHISRLFRDQTLIDGLRLGELCKEHNVIIVIPNAQLNLADKLHMRIYRMELERASDELDIVRMRMGGAKDLKAKQGFYASGSVPVGYIVNKDKGNTIVPYDKYIAYEPHAVIVRRIFEIAPIHQFCFKNVARQLRGEGWLVPPFPPELGYMEGRSAVANMKRVDANGNGDGGRGGYVITSTFVNRVLSNPAYIGWWIWGGEVVSKRNHEAIIDEETFWYVQEQLSRRRKNGSGKGRAVYSESLMLNGLLYCVNPQHLARIGGPFRVTCEPSIKRYRCHGTYNKDVDGEGCFSITAATLNKPIEEFVLSLCSFPEYGEKLVAHILEQYDAAKRQAEINRRELMRLTKEIENLKENLGYTKTKEQAEMILEMIDRKMKEKHDKSRVENYAAGRVGQTLALNLNASSGKPGTRIKLDVENLKGFLRNIRTIWPYQPESFKNEFLQIMLDRILIYPCRNSNNGDLPGNEEGITKFKIEIESHIGLQGKMTIHRPDSPSRRDHRWSKTDEEKLRRLYPAATWKQIFESLPNRNCFCIPEHAKRLRLKRRSEAKFYGKGNPWTKEEEAVVLSALQGTITMEEAIVRTGRTPYTVKAWLRQKGLFRGQFSNWKEYWKEDYWQVEVQDSDHDAGTESERKDGGNGDEADDFFAFLRGRDVYQAQRSRSWGCRIRRCRNRANGCAPRSRTRTSFTPSTSGSP